MEAVQQELIRSNEMLATQVWILGGLISFLLMLLIGLARGAWNDMRKMIDDHEGRLTELEKFRNERERMIEDHEKTANEHRDLLGKLSTTVATLSK
jgi:hypothetical protein